MHEKSTQPDGERQHSRRHCRFFHKMPNSEDGEQLSEPKHFWSHHPWHHGYHHHEGHPFFGPHEPHQEGHPVFRHHGHHYDEHPFSGQHMYHRRCPWHHRSYEPPQLNEFKDFNRKYQMTGWWW